MNTELPNDGKAGSNSTTPPKDSNTPPKIILPGLEFFEQLNEKPPENIMKLMCPMIDDEMSAMAGEGGENLIALFCGIMPEEALASFGKTYPEWVRLASKKFLEAIGFDFFGKLQSAQPDAMGTFSELTSKTPPHARILSPAINAFFNLGHYMKLASANMPAKEQKQFAEGRMSVSKMSQKIKNPSERITVFAILTFRWREVEKLDSQVKTYNWLKENKIISPYTTDAEVRRWFREINLPKGKAGRPSKKNTDTPKNG